MQGAADPVSRLQVVNEAAAARHQRWPRSQAIIDQASAFLWSDELRDAVRTFTQNHASMFVGAEIGGEQRFEWTEAHQDFQQVFELHLEQFIAQQDFSAADFLTACQDALDHGGWAHTKKMVVEAITA
eukprot:COSAG05_NODE_2368_length_3166_cov_220.486677_1_plen_127_part_10